jgi:very-short-patch-repair endonuclease
MEKLLHVALADLIEEPGDVIPQFPLGIYVADFLIFPKFFVPAIIECDGQETHKTKEQRYADCVKARFLMRHGYMVIRFTGSEIWVDAVRCAEEAIQLATRYEKLLQTVYDKGVLAGKRGGEEDDGRQMDQNRDEHF